MTDDCAEQLAEATEIFFQVWDYILKIGQGFLGIVVKSMQPLTYATP